MYKYCNHISMFFLVFQDGCNRLKLSITTELFLPKNKKYIMQYRVPWTHPSSSDQHKVGLGDE